MELSNDISEKLRKCVYEVYVTSGGKYNDFLLEIIEDKQNTVNGEYFPNKRLLRVFKDTSNSYELMFLTAIHELSHHVCFIQKGDLSHNKQFKETEKKLLYASFDLGYCDPCRLAIAEMYLSNHAERNLIIKLCNEYIKKKEITPKWKMTMTFFNKKVDKTYNYSPILKGYYKFIEN